MKKYLARLFSFAGREGRLNYVLAAWLLPSIAAMIVEYTTSLFVAISVLAVTVPAVAAFTARRLHDLNFSAWWLLTSCCSVAFFSNYRYLLEVLPVWFLALCVLISAAGNLYLIVVPGQKEANQYGMPLAAPARDVVHD